MQVAPQIETAARPASQVTPAGRAVHPPKRSLGLRVFFVAAAVCLFALVFVVGVGIWGILKIRRQFDTGINQISGLVGMIDGIQDLAKIEELAAEYEAKGYTRDMRQVTVIKEPINDKRLFVAQMVEIQADVKDDLAILGQVATIKGTVHGDLDFMGQALIIEENAVITGDVFSRFAQIITVKGSIEGELRGAYQVLDSPGKIAKQSSAKEVFDRVKTTLQEGPASPFASARRANDNRDDAEAVVGPLEEVLTRCLRGSTSDRRRALEELAAMQPQATTQDQVVRTAVHCLNDRNSVKAAIDVLEVWAEPGDAAPGVFARIEKDYSPDSRLLELLLRWEAEEQVVKLIHHQSNSVSKPAWDAVVDWKTDHSKLVAQCIADLSKRGFRGHSQAMKHLGMLEIHEEATRAVVVKMMLAHWNEHWAISDAPKILSRLLQESDLPHAKTARIYRNQEAFFEVLANLESAEADAHLVMLAVEKRQAEAVSVIESELKSRAEPALWTYLEHRSFITRRHAIELIEKVGTEHSVPHLENLLGDTMNKRNVEQALDTIASRQGSPSEP